MRYLSFNNSSLTKLSLIFTVILVALSSNNPNAHSLGFSKTANHYFNYLYLQESQGTDTKNKSVVSDSRLLLMNLRADFCHILGKKGFYAVYAGLAIPPLIFKSELDNESLAINHFLDKSKFADNFFELGEYSGSAFLHLPVSLIIYYIGGKKPDSKIKSFGSDLFSAHVINGFATLGLKHIINRTRPSGTAYSYPSGHASTAFTSAGVIYNHFGLKWGIPAYLGAIYVGFSRLQENVHYPSDVIAGAVLGTYIAFNVTHREDKKSKFTFRPFIIEDTPGVRFAFQF
jgi:membrane-associated phospholipid phosphatase